jgi:hypothetical protein
MGIDHCGFQIHVTQQFLDSPNVGTVVQQVGGENVPQRVNRYPFVDPRLAHGLLDVSLQAAGVQLVTPHLARDRLAERTSEGNTQNQAHFFPALSIFHGTEDTLGFAPRQYHRQVRLPLGLHGFADILDPLAQHLT